MVGLVEGRCGESRRGCTSWGVGTWEIVNCGSISAKCGFKEGAVE